MSENCNRDQIALKNELLQDMLVSKNNQASAHRPTVQLHLVFFCSLELDIHLCCFSTLCRGFSGVAAPLLHRVLQRAASLWGKRSPRGTFLTPHFCLSERSVDFSPAQKLEPSSGTPSSCGPRRVAHVTQIGLNTRGDPQQERLSPSQCFSLPVYCTSQHDWNNDPVHRPWPPLSCSASSQRFILQCPLFCQGSVYTASRELTGRRKEKKRPSRRRNCVIYLYR